MLRKNDIWCLMAKCIFGEATAQEKDELQLLLRDNPELQHQFSLVSAALQQQLPQNEQLPASAETKSKIAGIIAKAAKQEKKQAGTVIRVRRYMAIAAASIIVLGLGAWFYMVEHKSSIDFPKNIQPAHITQNGSRRQITLPDGTKVWLNGGSKLFYNNNFKGATREVTLEGEAFFDVVKNTGKPFVVHANNINIKVLGTAFNVKAYTEDENVETTLYRGLVNITKSGDEAFQPIMLYPNQKIIVPIVPYITEANAASQSIASHRTTKSIEIRQIDSTRLEPLRVETAWIYNRLEFRGDDFVTLARKLERWYNIKIIFQDDKVTGLNFNGSFEKESIEQALLALTTANSFNYKIQNNEVFISSSK